MIAIAKRKIGLAGALSVLLLGTISLLFIPLPAIQSPGVLALLGRLHPLLVHFPIVLVPLLTLSYFLLGKKERASLTRWLQIGWLVTLVVTVSAVGAGYLLYASGEYGGMLVERHLQAGVVVAVSLIAAYLMVLWEKDLPVSKNVLLVLLITNAALVYTGHLGGSLTHGEGFLRDALPRPGEAAMMNKLLEESNIYADLVVPILETNCMSCHNENKSKGDLVLTSYAQMNAGGKSGKPALVVGAPEESELYLRVNLPPSDEDVMPPEGKSPLSSVEVDIIKWWIAEGASTDMIYGRGPQDSLLALQIENFLPSLRGARIRQLRTRKQFRTLYAEFVEVANPLGLDVKVDADSDSSLFNVSVQFPSDIRIDDNTVAALRPFAPYISSLSLVGTDISDDALYHVASMRQLQELYVPNTALDGSGLAYLKDLDQLTLLNLSNTEFANAYVFNIASLRSLSTLYVFDTQLEESIEEALKVYREDVDVRHEEGPFNKR